MTSGCPGGGPSQPKSGVVDVLVYAAGAASIVNIPPSYAWIKPFLPLLGNLVYHTDPFCAADPPPIPTFTLDEYNAFLALTFDTDYWNFLGKLKDAVGNLVWNTVCECVPGPTPAPTALPPPPSDTQYVPTSTSGNSCTSEQFNPSNISSTAPSIFSGILNWDGTASTNAPTCNCVGTGVHIVMDTQAVVTPGWSVDISVEVFPRPSGASSVRQVYRMAPNDHLDVVMPVNNATDKGVWLRALGVSGGVGQTSVRGSLAVYCNGLQPTGAATACCPPDTTVLTMLDHILKQVDLIQRQNVPFSYVPGPAHTGLTGAGQLTVQGILGFKVSFTTVPAWLGEDVGVPIHLWGLGWCNVGNVDGWQPRQWFADNPQVLFPVDMGAMTKIGYSLKPGVVATITELVREP